MSKKLIIIGGGAAGFFCAIEAAHNNPSLSITIIEKQANVLQKVKVSGGGRCNVTHACFSNAELVKKYPRGASFLKKAFAHFTTTNTIEWFRDKGIILKTEADGRMFPSTDTSQTIIDCLLKEVSKYGIHLQLKTSVESIQKTKQGFRIELKNKEVMEADFVVVATGGFPKIEQYHWLTDLGHSIENPVPSLFTFNCPNKNLHELMGLSIPNASVKIIGSKLQEQGSVLITHWGLSGPAILRLSAWGARELAQKEYHFQIAINWINMPESELRLTWNSIRNLQSSNVLGNKNPFGLPNRLWDYILTCCTIDPKTKWGELQMKEQNKLMHHLTAHELEVKGKTTFKEEFVTCGGIKLNEIDASTMESKLVPNLFFAGEIMDVDGITGGFNFQHAWTSGYLAANGISKKIN